MSIRYLIVLLLLIGCAITYEINENDVSRIIKTLSSDEMQGRTINSSGIDRAANFIAAEFESMGLQQLDGVDFFKQTFTIKSASIAKTSLIINDTLIPHSSCFMQLSDDSIVWIGQNNPEVRFIGKEDDFRRITGEALESASDLLLIVSNDHKNLFKRYYSHFSQPKMFLDENKNKANVVFVLADVEKVETLKVEATRILEPIQLTNLIGVIEGKRPDEMVLFSAHYDHLGIGQSVGGDSIYNGANDDASGVTAVIELARYFQSQAKPERTLVFVVFTAEEVGGYGSQYFSKQLNPSKIVAMLNIEMIGKISNKGLNSAWMTGWGKSDLGDILQKKLKEVDFEFFEDPYPEQNLFYRSDNATLARLGVPAHSISTTQIDIDEDYHQLSDEIGTLDIENITNTIKAIAVSSQSIVDGRQTPTRVDPEQVRN